MYAYCLVSLLSIVLSFAQNSKIQQLHKSIEGLSKKDTQYVNQLNQLAYAYHTQEVEKTKQYAAQALRESIRLDYKAGIAKSNANLAIFYMIRNDYAQGLELNLKALKASQSIQDKKGEASALHNIAGIYHFLKEYQKAIDYLNESLTINLQLNRKNKIADNYLGIGIIYVEMHKAREAIPYLEQSLRVFEELKDYTRIGQSLYNLGCCHLQLREYQNALDFTKRAIPILIEHYKGLLGGAKLQLAKIYVELNNVLLAQANLTEAFAHSRANQIKTDEVSCYLTQTKLDSLRGDFLGALQHHHKYVALKDSLFNIEKSKQIAHIQEASDAAQKEKENRALRKKSVQKEDEIQRKTLELRLRYLYLIISLVAFVITLLIAGLWYKYYRSKKKAYQAQLSLNQAIKRQNEEIRSQAESLQRANDIISFANQNLEIMVEERTKRIQEQHQRLVDYAFFNAHKVRGPLARMMGLMNILREGNAPNTEQEILLRSLDISAKELDNVVREINQMLDE
jgi:tetratricopeptide (TPR) repeat protein